VNRWCLKILGLEPGEGSCFGYQVGRCKGACVGVEPRALHLARIKLGLMKLRITPWPHPGPVTVRERTGEREELHLFDGWQHLATFEVVSSDVPLAELMRSACAKSRSFQYDDYRILERALRDARLRTEPLKGWPGLDEQSV